MSKIIQLSLLSIILLLTACEEKAKPVVTRNSDFPTPIKCMQLDSLDVDKTLINRLNELYSFDKTCPLTLTISYKKDIVCNSTQNVYRKNSGKFPKSYLKMELRKGLDVVYSYYIDLYHNVDVDDLNEGFKRLKQDLIENKPLHK